MNGCDKKYKLYLDYFNDNLDKYLDRTTKDYCNLLKEGVKYAVSDGGKRVRPVLCLATAEALGVKVEDVLPFCIAIELIHSYSLVHDDLPCMDDDDFRRGKLSTHKKFGEANGVLIGDALLNLAFETLFNSIPPKSNYLDAAKTVARFAGSDGMIKGQVLDLIGETLDEKDEKFLYEVYINKTSKLLTAPLLVPSIICDGKYYKELNDFGENLGVLFQITDDIMDVEGSLETIGKTPNKDEEENKLTSIRIYGLNGAKEKAKYHYEKCKNILKTVENSEFLMQFTDKMYLRKK